MVDNDKNSENNKIYNINQSLHSKNKDDKLNDINITDKFSSLQAIAIQYDSSNSDDDNKIITSVSNNQDYRNKKDFIITSDESSDSESDSSSESENNSRSSNCSYRKSNKSCSEDSESENQIKTKENRSKKFCKLKGEFDDLPPIQDLKISVPEVLCDLIGEIAWTVEQMVVVCPTPGKPVLNLDTVLFIEKGQRALGHIFDVFGQVTQPYYCVRFNSADHILQYDIKVGMTVYYCPNTPYTSVVFLNELTKMKAIDEVGDEEPPQFSDDEEELAYLESIKKKFNNENVKEIHNRISNKRKWDWQSKYPSHMNKKNDIQGNTCSYNSKPFYRNQHPWTRLKYQQQSVWQRHSTFSNDYWLPNNFPYNEMHYSNPMNLQKTEISNVKFPQMQYNSIFQLPQMKMVSFQQFPQTLIPPSPPFTLPPPPPPPLPPHNLNK